jgi:hypothetical protein
LSYFSFFASKDNSLGIFLVWVILQVDIKKLEPPQQVKMLISTLERRGDIVPLVEAVDNQYRSYRYFINTKNYLAYTNEKLLELLLSEVKRDDEYSLPSLLNLLRIVCRIGDPYLRRSCFHLNSQMCLLVLLVVVSDVNKVAVAKQGGIGLILHTMRSHFNHAGVQQHGFGALMNLAVNCEFSIFVFFFFSSVLPFQIDLL